jgi:hypothetical protein
MLVYRSRDGRGTVHWYKGGLVRLYLRGDLKLARVKELFCKAFKFIPEKELYKFVDAPLREESKHWVFDVGSPLPRFDIRQFERTHGLRIYVDGSHPTALEVEETEPFWLHTLTDAVEAFGVYLKDHLALVGELREGRKTEVEILRKLTALIDSFRQRNEEKDSSSL